MTEWSFFRGDFLGHHSKAAQSVRAECRSNCNIRRIAAAGDQHAADAGDVVARIKGVPGATEVGFEPGCEIHRRVRDRHADIAKITRAVSRRDVHAATEGDSEVSIVPADAGAIAVSLPGRPGGARVFIAEGNVLVNKIADRLDPAPAGRSFPE